MDLVLTIHHIDNGVLAFATNNDSKNGRRRVHDKMGERKRDEDTGRYTEKYSSEEVVAAIQDVGGTAATSEIADALDASRNTIYKRLSSMEENDVIVSRKAGGIRVWSVVGSDDRE